MQNETVFLFLFLSLALPGLGCSDSTNRYGGMPEHVQKRHLNLEGAPNFRDLGGYPTDDEREVRWGLFFRSDNLHDLTDSPLYHTYNRIVPCAPSLDHFISPQPNLKPLPRLPRRPSAAAAAGRLFAGERGDAVGAAARGPGA